MALKIVQKRIQNEPEIEHRFGTMFLASGSRRGSSLGPFLDPFGGHFGVDFRPRARPLILAKNVPAPRREHDFQGPNGRKNSPKLVPKRSRKSPAAPCLPQERLGGLLDASWPRCWVPFGPRKGPQNPSKSDLDLEANLTLAQATTHTKTANWAPQTAPPDICRLDARRGALKRPPSRGTFRRSDVPLLRRSVAPTLRHSDVVPSRAQPRAEIRRKSAELKMKTPGLKT